MLPPKPSTYVPFLRRFTNEREKELAETEALYDVVKQWQDAFSEDLVTIGWPVYEHYAKLPEPISDEFAHAMFALIQAEENLQPLLPLDLDKKNLREFVEFRNYLHRKHHFFANQQEVLYRLHAALVEVFAGLAREFPLTQAPSPFTIPLIYTLTEPRLLVERTYSILGTPDHYDRNMFRGITEQLYRNICKASGRDPEDTASKKAVIHATESKLPLEELVDTYFAETPFLSIVKTPVALKLTHEERFNHMHIVGGTGAGKTSLIEKLILHDMQSEEPPSLVIIDPHSDLIKKLLHADLGQHNRLILIDPRDVKHPPALNIFALNRDRFEEYDEATREQVTAGVIQTFDYLFSGLIGADLTAKQGVFFRYVTRLLLAMPDTMGRNATILDMLKLMSDATPYQPAIESLPDIPRAFFEQDFASKTFQQTKEQIRYRIQAILENPTMARLFTSPETKIDLFKEMNEGSIILVDTAKDYLKGASDNFGRVFISLALQAILERAAIDPTKRRPVFIIVDEAASYFDSNIDDLLTDARKYKCGLVLAHQYLDQASSSLKASLSANTGTKFASGLSAGDARSMAPDMRTTSDFIMDQPRLQFAAHIRNVTPHAVSIPVTPGSFANLPQLAAEQYEAFIEQNRERVSLPPAPPPEPEEEGVEGEDAPTRKALPSPQLRLSPPPHEDISSEW